MDQLVIKTKALPKSAFIKPAITPFIDHWSYIRCGSYTSEWIARCMGLNPPPSNTLLFGPIWFDMFRPIFPRDMQQLMRFKGMHTLRVNVQELYDQDKLNWVKTEIAIKKRPPALLIRTRTMHWIAIGGYDDAKQVFYVYDARKRYGKTSVNPKLPIGNAMIGYDELLKLWRGRTFLRYIGIEVTSVDPKLIT